MSAPLRHFGNLSAMEREGAMRIARALMRDGMTPEGVVQSMERRRQVIMPLQTVLPLQPRTVPIGEGPDSARRRRP